jgi:ABC-type nitrate/sulfonate/bicarbonate transport system substrate-binding protein
VSRSSAIYALKNWNKVRIVYASRSIPFLSSLVSTHVDKIKNKRAQVKNLIRAELESLKFIRERKEDTVELIARLFRMERDVAQKSYDFTASFFSKDARINPDGVKN